MKLVGGGHMVVGFAMSELPDPISFIWLPQSRKGPWHIPRLDAKST
jgi:hypothetical protein